MTTTIVFLIYYLAKDQKLQEEVQNEVDNYFQNLPDDQVDLNNLNSQLPLLSACIDETLRLRPPFRMIERICTKDYEYNGFKVSKGVNVMVPVWALHRNPVYFPDPETFNPTRFLPENKKSLNPFSIAVFGHGNRNCAGIVMSEILLKASLVKILREFSFHLCEETKVKYKTGRLFMTQYYPIYLEIAKRN